MPHASACRRPLIWRGVCHWDKSAITRRRRTSSQSNRRFLRRRLAACAALPASFGPIHPVRTRMAGDLTAHHRRATSNQISDTLLGQTRIHPRHDRRTIPGTKHPTTPHDQPPNSHTATRKSLSPNNTAQFHTDADVHLDNHMHSW